MYGKFKTRLDAFWRSYIPPISFLKILFLVPNGFLFMNFSEVMFYENYLTSDFHTNTVISSLENRDKAYLDDERTSERAGRRTINGLAD